MVPLNIAIEAPGSGRAFLASRVVLSTEALNITPEESTRRGAAVPYRRKRRMPVVALIDARYGPAGVELRLVTLSASSGNQAGFQAFPAPRFAQNSGRVGIRAPEAMTRRCSATRPCESRAEIWARISASSILASGPRRYGPKNRSPRAYRSR